MPSYPEATWQVPAVFHCAADGVGSYADVFFFSSTLRFSSFPVYCPDLYQFNPSAFEYPFSD